MIPNGYNDRMIPFWPANDPGFVQGVDWPLAPSPNAPISTDELYRLIWQYGVRVLWESASRCPCQAAAGDSSPQSGCPVCGGTGWYFHHPQATRAMATGNNARPSQMELIGAWQSGQVSMTVRAEYCPAKFDRFTLLDARMPFNFFGARKAAEGENEPLPWPIAAKTVDMADVTARTLDVLEILPMTAAGLPRVDEHGVPYPLVRGVEYDVVYTGFAAEARAVTESASPPSAAAWPVQQIGQIDWSLGDALQNPPCPPGRAFSITYQTMPVYMVTSYPHAVRDSRTNLKLAAEKNLPLPVQFVAELEFLRTRDAA